MRHMAQFRSLTACQCICCRFFLRGRRWADDSIGLKTCPLQECFPADRLPGLLESLREDIDDDLPLRRRYMRFALFNVLQCSLVQPALLRELSERPAQGQAILSDLLAEALPVIVSLAPASCHTPVLLPICSV